VEMVAWALCEKRSKVNTRRARRYYLVMTFSWLTTREQETRELILALLAERPLTKAELIVKLPCKNESKFRVLSSLILDGLIVEFYAHPRPAHGRHGISLMLRPKGDVLC
jgi:hypothetical protein